MDIVSAAVEFCNCSPIEDVFVVVFCASLTTGDVSIFDAAVVFCNGLPIEDVSIVVIVFCASWTTSDVFVAVVVVLQRFND
jgi:hypothetical protein